MSWFDNALIMVFIIFLVNVVYVSSSTIRMILTMKGRPYIAALVSTIEVILYIIGLSLVLDNLDGIQNIVAYAGGYALGIIVGSYLEDRLALGYITINVVSSNPDLDFTSNLRKEGFGVTSWISHGMDGDRLSMQILTPRKQELRLYQVIMEIDPSAFMIAYEPKYIKGGFWVRQVRKGRLFHQSGEKKGQQVDPPDVTLPELNKEYEHKTEMTEDELLQQGESATSSHNPNVTTKL